MSLPRINKFLIGLLAIGLAIYAQTPLRSELWFDTAVLLIVAVGLSLLAFRRLDWTYSLLPTRTTSGRWPWLGWGVVALALLLNLAMLFRLRGNVEEVSATDWWLYLGALFLLFAATLLMDRPHNLADQPDTATPLHTNSNDVTARWTWLILVILLLIGSALRLYRYDSWPYGLWYDEAENGLQALRIINTDNFYPLFVGSIHAPAHYLYLLVASFWLLGSTVEAIRAVSVVMGLASVLAGYLFGREWFGWRSGGLILAALMAFSRWNVNFSRIGMYNISTPLFTLLAAGFLLRGLRRGKLTDYALAGLSLGLGFCFYAAFQLFVAMLALFVLLLLLDPAPPKATLTDDGLPGNSAENGNAAVRFSVWALIGARIEHTWRGLLVMALGALLTVTPVLLYAYEKPDVYFDRTLETSLLARTAPEQRLEALWRNTRKHLLMFNVFGDPNGRHNLPGEPMLDRIAGALLILGAVLCLSRAWRARALLPLLWLAITLLGGILSLDFEAPQSLRAIGSLPAAYILAATPLFLLWQSWQREGGRWQPALGALAPGLLLCGVLIGDAHTYFARQSKDFAAWNAFSTPETITAQRLKEVAPDTQAYVISYFAGHPTLNFLASGVAPYQRIDTTDHLPLAWPADKNVELLLNDSSRVLFEEARHYYPNAIFEEITAPFGGPPVIFRAHLRRQDIESVQGLQATYFANQSWQGQPVLQSKELLLDQEWPTGARLPLPFSVEWQGVLQVTDYGVHQFFLRAPAQAELLISEQQVLSGTGELTGGLVLAKGNHTIRVRAVGGNGRFSLAWRPPSGDMQVMPPAVFFVAPVTANGLLGRYFPNDNWQGVESFAQIDPQLNLYFHITPLPRPYTVEWSGKIAIPQSGDYRFGLESIDESYLAIDGQEVTAALEPNQLNTGQITLNEGLHDIQIRYKDRTDHTHINLYWTPPGHGQQPVPSSVLFPPQGNYERVTVPGLAELFFNAPAPSPSGEPGSDVTLAADVREVLGDLNHPFGIAAGADGRIYVADTGNKRVLILTPDGAVQTIIGPEQAPFEEPFDLALSPAGLLYVMDSTTGQIPVFDSDGRLQKVLALGEGVIDRARGIAVDLDGQIWVAHTPGGNVVAIDSEGQRLSELLVRGTEEAQPVDVAVGVGGNIFVADGAKNKLILFTKQGQRLFSWDIPVANTLTGSHLAVDNHGLLYLTEPEPGNIARLGADGTRLGVFRLREAGVIKPVGVAADPQGNLWTVDNETGKVFVVTPK